jgi:2-(1,2-epoxy-1,2-dihydrophenyl)acetyl-CoA isomerase
MDATVLYNLEGNVGKIILNRPEKFNSFNREMSLALQDALKECSKNENVRAVYLTGSGKAFSAGQDLSEAVSPSGPGIQKIVEEHYNPIILAIRNIEKPVVCAVNGVAAGAGANIALACDIIVAAKSASFLQAFSKIGLVPDSGGTFFLPRLIGFQRATALMMLGDKINAEEALAMGMIYKIFEDAELENESWKITLMLSEMATRGLGLTKQLLNKTFTNSLEQQLIDEGKFQTRAAATEDFKAGVKAFLEKQKPVFSGK